MPGPGPGSGHIAVNVTGKVPTLLELKTDNK